MSGLRGDILGTLPFQTVGFSGMTCRRLLWSWQVAGLGDRAYRYVFDRLNLAGSITKSRASVDSSSIAAKR